MFPQTFPFAEKYFMAEKQGAFWLMMIGVVAIVLAMALFFAVKTSFYKGAAVGLLAIALILIGVGTAVYKRSDAQRKDMIYKLSMNPDAIQNGEIPRMEKVIHSFSIYCWVEILLVIGGVALFIAYRQNKYKDFWAGLGIAIAVLAAVVLVFDAIAEKRGKVYLAGVRKVVGK